jgi:hypothetical protein
MSSIGGPGIIRDGLVLYVDAANEKCFRGEPTTNNANQSVNVGNSQITVSNTDVIGPEGKIVTASKITINSDTGVVRMRMYNISNVIPTIEQYYTISCWIKRNNNVNITGGWESELNNDPVYTYARPGFESGYVGVYNAHPNTQTIPGEWTRVVYTFKYAVQPTAIVNHFFYFSGLGGEVLFYGFQFEEKAYATPFVIGTRGTTVATGGGLIDLSKNGSNGELINGVTYNSSNGGNLVFDGTTGYLIIPNNENIVFNDNDFSVGFWVKTPITSVGESSGWGPIISKGCTTSAPAGSWWVAQFSTTNNRITLNISSTDGGTFVTSLTTGILADGWHHIFATRIGSTAYLYSDGILQGTDVTSSSNLTNTSPLTICTTYNTIKRTGLSLSGTKLYNRSLSLEEILQNYNATKSRFGL